MRRELESAKESFEFELSSKAEWMYSKLAFEIDRTKAIETTVDRMKLRDCEEMTEMAKQTQESELRSQERNNAIEAQCNDKVDTLNLSKPPRNNKIIISVFLEALQKTKEQLKEELDVQMKLNEQEIERVSLRAQQKEDEAEERCLQAAKASQLSSMELLKSKEDIQKLKIDCAKHIEVSCLSLCFSIKHCCF